MKRYWITNSHKQTEDRLNKAREAGLHAYISKKKTRQQANSNGVRLGGGVVCIVGSASELEAAGMK